MATSYILSQTAVFKTSSSDNTIETSKVQLTRATSDSNMISSERIGDTIPNVEMSNCSKKNSHFLPKLPEKIFQTYRLTSAQSNKKSYPNNAFKDTCNRPLFNRNKTLTHKGDLLRASQIYILDDSRMSETIKHIKTADTPWIGNVSTNKSYNSILYRNQIELSEFFFKHQQKKSNTYKTFKNSEDSSELNKWLQNSSKGYCLQKNKTEISTTKSAEGLSLENLTESFNDFSNLEPTSQKFNIALHALNTVWELNSHVLESSPFLTELYQEHVELQTPEFKKSLKNFNCFGPEKFEKMFHILLKITDPLVNKQCLAVALSNLYHPKSIQVPGKYVAGTLAAANLLKFKALIDYTIKKMAYSLNKNIITDCYLTSKKYQHQDAVDTCESWLELNLVSDLKSLNFLKSIPLDLLKKIIKSRTTFVKSEYSKLMVILYWIFFRLNPTEDKSPTESVIFTYFSSFSKEKSLIEKHTEFKEILLEVRLFGMTKSNLIAGIQQMNLYPHSYLIKIMLEIQQSLEHGGDMNIYRNFENSAIRHGYKIDVDLQGQYSEIFSLYGFYFELISEKVVLENAKYIYQFHIQRLSSKCPILTYEQSQLEMFSLRNDRLCTYSISVQYWNNGKRNFESTGTKRHIFGSKLSQSSPIFEIEVEFSDDLCDNNLKPTGIYKNTNEISVMFSLNFPSD